MIRVADYIMDFLAARGVRDVFLLPGGGAMHLNDALGRSEKLRYYSFLHEQALAIAAESYGQHRGFPGVGAVTSGPGSTNAVTAVAAAFFDSTPMFMLSGQAKRSDLKTGTGVRQMGSQEVDIVSMVGGITKYAVTVLEPEMIRFHLEKAWYMATGGRMGPVWLDIPLDVQGAVVDENSLKGFSVPEKTVYEIPVRKLAGSFACSRRPLLMIGNGARPDGCAERLIRWAEEYDIPVMLTWKTVDMLGYDHPLNMGTPGIMGSRYANFIVQNCDCLLIVGSRLDPSLTAFNSRDFGRNAKRIMVDIDEAEIRKTEGIDLRIVSSASAFADALDTFRPNFPEHGGWLDFCAGLKRKYPVFSGEAPACRDGVDLYYFTEVLFDELTEEDIIVPESSGAAGEVTYQGIKIKKGQKIRNAAGLGSMGFGLPYAVGAALANDRKRTVLINGDGAFQMNIQELETVRRLKLPIKMFIWDNDGYGSIVNTQRNMFGGFLVGSDRSSGLTLPDVCALAGVYGMRALSVDRNEDLREAIRRTLDGDDPVICRVVVTRNHRTMPKVQAERLPDGRMVSHPLEDMWPYLPEAERAENMRPAER